MAAKKGTKRKPRTPEQEALKAFRKASETHTAVFEVELSHEALRHVLNQAKSVAYVKRRLRAYCRRRLEQYKRTRKYRETIKAYHKAIHKDEKKALGAILLQLQIEAGLTLEDVTEQAKYWAKRSNVLAVFAQTAAEDVWSGVEDVLYKGAKKLGKKKNERLSMRAKQYDRAIRIKATDDGNLFFEYDKERLVAKIEDDDVFLLEEQAAIVAWLRDADADRKAVEHMRQTGEMISTYRPKYVTLVMEEVRGRWRVRAHVTVEGAPKEKKRKDGTPRFERAVNGEIGCDIGTQSYAAVGANICEMKNLAERNGKAIQDEARLRRLQRHADRCLRASNAQNYNEDGSIKRGKKEWVHSKEYKRTQERIRAYHRKCALNRKYSIQEDVNRLREHGSVIVSEKQSVRGWQAGLFGKSVQSRCPGAFRAELKRKFADYIEVDLMFRASQYDHEHDEYVKKKLSQRTHCHEGGRASPRDAYSGFLLWCHDKEYASPDRELCLKRFDDYYERVSVFVEDCKKSGRRVVNGGF